MKKALLSLLFTALPALSHAGECRQWKQPNKEYSVWLQACAEDAWTTKAGYDYEFIGQDETGGPGILYTHPSGDLQFHPAYWIPSQDNMRLADGGPGGGGWRTDIGTDLVTLW